MRQHLMFYFLLLIGLSINAQSVNISGKVTNQAGKPVSNANVELVNAGLKDTTGSDGAFSIATTNIQASFKSEPRPITLTSGSLDFSLVKPSPVNIEVFDINGALIKKVVQQNAQAGLYRFNVDEISHTSKLLVIRVSTDQQKVMFRYIPMNNGKYVVNSSSKNLSTGSSKLAKIADIVDTIRVTAENYKVKSIPIGTLDTAGIEIKLDTAAETTVTVHLDQEKQTIQGFGINATIMPGGKSLPWEELFTSDLTKRNALGLSILRIGMHENGGHRDVPSDWETARNTYGAKIIGSCWSAPREMKSNGKTTAGGYLKPENYNDWAKKIAQYAASNKLYAMSIANESDFASCGSGPGEKPCSPPLTDEYESMVYTAKQMVEFVKVARKAFDQYAPDVKLIAPEASLWIHVWSNLSCIDKYKSSDPHGCGCYSNNINDSAEIAKCAQKCKDGDGYDYGHWLAKDTEAWNAVDILGVHQYESQVAYPWPADVTGGKRTKEIWQTEMSGVMYWPEQGPSTDIRNGVAVGRWIQSGLMVGEASAWCYWWYEAYYQNDNEGLALIKGSNTIAKRYYTFGNYSRYIRPGHKIVNITSTDKLPEKVLLTASKDDAGKVVIVAVNETESEQTVPITISGGTVPTTFTPIVTNNNENWAEKSAVTATDGVLTVKLEKMSVTTFVSK